MLYYTQTKERGARATTSSHRTLAKGVKTVANATIVQQVNRQTVATALTAARKEAAEHKAWMNAINRAALNLEACGWSFDGEVLQIASATGAARYTVDCHGCQCKAATTGSPCWHRAARRLLIKAAEMATVPAVATVNHAALAAAQADVDALFG